MCGWGVFLDEGLFIFVLLYCWYLPFFATYEDFFDGIKHSLGVCVENRPSMQGVVFIGCDVASLCTIMDTVMVV